VLKAALKKDQSKGLSSKTMFLGLGRKLMMLILVMMAVQLDTLLQLDSVSRLAVIGFYVANEALSIVENAALLGVPFPKQVLSSLEAMREKEGVKKNDQ
jgi:toxin secretion/phage lysis holin